MRTRGSRLPFTCGPRRAAHGRATGPCHAGVRRRWACRREGCARPRCRPLFTGGRSSAARRPSVPCNGRRPAPASDAPARLPACPPARLPACPPARLPTHLLIPPSITARPASTSASSTPAHPPAHPPVNGPKIVFGLRGPVHRTFDRSAPAAAQRI